MTAVRSLSALLNPVVENSRPESLHFSATNLTASGVPVLDLSLLSPLQPRRAWTTEDARRNALESDPWAYDIEPHSVACRNCHRSIRLNATGRYYAANWNKHKLSCKASRGGASEQLRSNGQLPSFRLNKTKDGENISYPIDEYQPIASAPHPQTISKDSLYLNKRSIDSYMPWPRPSYRDERRGSGTIPPSSAHPFDMDDEMDLPIHAEARYPPPPSTTRSSPTPSPPSTPTSPFMDNRDRVSISALTSSSDSPPLPHSLEKLLSNSTLAPVFDWSRKGSS